MKQRNLIFDKHRAISAWTWEQTGTKIVTTLNDQSPLLFILLSCLFLLLSFYSFSSPLLLLVFILLFPFSSAPCILSLLSSFCLFLLSSVSFLPSFPSFSRFHPPLNFSQTRKNRPVYDYRNHSPSQRTFSHISRTIRIRFSQKKRMIHVSRTWRSIKFEHVSILNSYIYISVYLY